ncbi:MAG: hypothetical protein OCU24_06320 [Candidatus Methanospirare jalkutatii]|nr:hypothetical protein [Candidatus Methanospirare jalkutatii]
MDIERLWEILDRERRTRSLQALPENFCEEVRAYLRRLEEAFAAAEDERRREFLRDERRNARMRVEDIVRLRVGKIVKIASSGSKTVPKGMLPAEREIYLAVRTQVEDYMRKMLAELFGETAGEEAGEEAGEKAGETASHARTLTKKEKRENEKTAGKSANKGTAAKEEGDSERVSVVAERQEETKKGRMKLGRIFDFNRENSEDNINKNRNKKIESGSKGERKSEEEAGEMTKEDKEIVRILTEIPSFLGTDGRIYRLHREDVVVLPRENAEILCGRGVAVRIKPRLTQRRKCF